MKNLSKEKEIVKAEFKAAWQIIVDDIISDSNFSTLGNERTEWLEQLLEKNVPFGKQTRAYLSVGLYRQLNPSRSEEDDFLTYVSGWMIEILQASALIADDIMDNSETRRGTPCWYRNVGMMAVSDAFFLENIIYYIAFKYFRGQDYLLRLLELINDNNFKTILGESFDVRLANTTEIDFNRFTEKNYQALVKYKTSYYTFYSPVATAMIRSGIKEEKCYAAVEDVTLKTGEIFQIQDDFLDCYGDPDITGKIGSDIKDGKLTWLIIKALDLASDSQRKLLQEHYGQQNVISEYEVKNIYEELGLEEFFYKHEDDLRLEILQKISALPQSIPKDPFLNVLDIIYKREK